MARTIQRRFDQKPVPRGLTRFTPPNPAGFGFLTNYILAPAWSDLEPADGDYSGPGWDTIDNTLAANPKLMFSLRLFTGRFSPDFIKSGSGGPIAIFDPPDNLSGTVPRWWDPWYQLKWKQLCQEVSRRYDDNERIVMVTASACMTFWAEPFLRTSDLDSNEALFQAGLNETTDRQALRQTLADQIAAFPRTCVSMATHSSWQVVVGAAGDPTDGKRNDWPAERTELNWMRDTFGQRMLFQNNGLGGDDGTTTVSTPTTAATHFEWMNTVAHTAPVSYIGFQTEADSNLAPFTVYDAVDRALEMGACWVEHNNFGSDLARASAQDRALKQQAP